MLGLGTKLFISSEDPDSYGTVFDQDRDFGSGNYSTLPLIKYHTYYIQNDRITTSFNQDEVNFVHNDRGRRNVYHKSINDVEGSFTFNLQYNMLKLLSLFTNYKPIGVGSLMNRQNLSYNADNTLNFSHYEITTVPNGTNTSSFLKSVIYYPDPIDDNGAIIVKSKLVNHPIISLQLRHKNTNDMAHYLYGCCMNSLNIDISQDTPVTLTINFLGQRENKVDWNYNPINEIIEDVYADIYPSWSAKLELDVDDTNGYQEYPYKDFSLEINNNLQFAPFIESTYSYPSNAPKPGLRETTGSFTIEYSDELDDNNKNFYDYVTECKDNIKLKLTLQDGNSKFIVECENFTSPEGRGA